MSLLHVIRYIVNHPLNRGRKLKALARFAKWQIGSRLVPGAVAFEWINGARLLINRSESTLTANIYTGLHEYPDTVFLIHALRPEDLFIDVGANLGSYTILAASVAGARVYAFEPIPSTYERLLDNVRLNRLEQRATCFNQGIGAGPGTIAFTGDSGATNHALASGEQNDSVVDVEVTSLDIALRDELPALIKIDVEGYETPVLEGAEETLKKPSLHSVILELNGSGDRYGFDESRLRELMFDHGFRTYSYDPAARSLVESDGTNPYTDNTLFVRHIEAVLDRLKSAPKICIHGKEL